MSLHESEIEQARKIVADAGRNPDDFSFAVEFLPPDPDGAGMFTVQYEVRIAERTTDKALTLIGGIGMNWVASFEDALNDQYFG